MTQLLEATIPQNVCGARNLFENALQVVKVEQTSEGCPERVSLFDDGATSGTFWLATASEHKA